MTSLNRSIRLALAGIGSLTLTAAPVLVYAQSGQVHASSEQHYMANLSQLNNTGASGVAHLYQEGRTLRFHLDAKGLEPGKVHPMHIHGLNNPEVANCPTPAADTNKDGLISVIEGAPSYGPIKLNLTNPQTAFGEPATRALFTQFAGKANNANFPVAKADGTETFDATYTFDNSAAAEGAFKSLTPLTNQHVVLHGAEAPASVDADAFKLLGAPVKAEDMNKVVYDALLPVACGQIDEMTETPDESPAPSASPMATPAPVVNSGNNGNGGNQGNNNGNHANNGVAAAVAQFKQHFESLTSKYDNAEAMKMNMQVARDMYVRDFYEARNQFVDQMNQNGDVATRDMVSSGYQHMLEMHIQ